ncbi:MAG: hypothetical protein ACRELX_04920 [Longimicrobiales bacterium]
MPRQRVIERCATIRYNAGRRTTGIRLDGDGDGDGDLLRAAISSFEVEHSLAVHMDLSRKRELNRQPVAVAVAVAVKDET